jgi:flagellar hook protein FlgE
MMRALFSGVSGLRNHQTRMDVIGNNIANVNTVAFKASRVTFKEAFVQLLQGAGRPPGGLGGTNPVQIGTGIHIGSTDQLFTQGSLETTGQPLDLAIQGDGMFVVSNGTHRVYTRAGNFSLDASGLLVMPGSGYVVQGILADSTGSFASTSAIGDIRLTLGDKAPARATSQIGLTGNLDARAAVGDVHSMAVTVYDALGTPHELRLEFTNTGPGAWSWTATSTSAPVTPAGTGTLTFGGDGSLATFTYPGGGTGLTLTPAGGTPFTVAIDPGTVGGIDGLAGFSNPSNGVIESQDGYPAGGLVDVTVDSRGIITGFFTNGVSRSLAQIALASFNNPAGLQRAGGNIYTETANSGLAVIGFAGGTDTSTITAGALESSNVDIAQEFTNMIITQRGFQANARVISTADEMLNEMVNIRR